MDLTPPGGSPRLVSAVTISLPSFQVFVTQEKQLAVCLFKALIVLWYRLIQAWEWKTVSWTEITLPYLLLFKKCISNVWSFHSGQQSLPCAFWLWGLAQFRMLILVTLGCIPELSSFTTAHTLFVKAHFHWKYQENPFPLLTVGAELSHCTHEVRQCPQRGGLESMCWVARQPCSAVHNGR